MKKYLMISMITLASARAAHAQNELAAQCDQAGLSAAAVQQCGFAAVALGEMQEAIGLAFSGGNPLPGASSTLGMRLGAIPRVSAALRLSGARITTQGFPNYGSDDFTSMPRAVNLDVAVGVFGGLSLLPTVGGFGSIDLLASVGTSTLSDDDGFVESPTSWGVGARVGLLRESFTAPGVSVSAMYRQIGDIENGDLDSNDQDAFVSSESNSVISLRGTVGKRILVFGATAGVAYDKYSGDAAMHIRTTPGVNNLQTFEAEGFGEGRTSFFGNISWTMLILHVVGEFGIQKGDGNTYFGGLAIRLAL